VGAALEKFGVAELRHDEPTWTSTDKRPKRRALSDFIPVFRNAAFLSPNHRYEDLKFYNANAMKFEIAKIC
jgi:hypothetical protein